VYAGLWESCEYFSFWDYPLLELAGKTIGIIGFGSIGRATGKIVAALGMNIMAYSSTETDEGRQIGRYVTLDELLEKSDVISLHCPLTPATQDIINAGSIAKMKDGAIILNTARGPLIAEQDLADALESGKLMAAAVDVASVEPIKGDIPLLKAKNCFITPHIAWASIEARSRLMDIACANVSRFLAGRPVNVVNP